MPLKWAANENPVVSSKLNKMSVTFWANEAAIVTTEVQIGSIVYLEDKAKLFQVKTISPLVLTVLGGGGGSVKYPFGSYKEQIDHFDYETFPNFLASAQYTNATWEFNTTTNDELDNHSIIITQIINTAEKTNSAKSVNIYHTKRDMDNPFTKVNIELRSKFRVRAANLKHWLGLIDSVSLGSPATTTIRKISVFENNGNFFLRTSDGTTESDMDSSTVADTSIHRHKMIWSNVPNVEYLIDGVSKGTKTTNIPDNALTIFMAMKNDSGSDQNGDVHDYWHTKME